MGALASTKGVVLCMCISVHTRGLLERLPLMEAQMHPLISKWGLLIAHVYTWLWTWGLCSPQWSWGALRMPPNYVRAVSGGTWIGNASHMIPLWVLETLSPSQQ